MSTLNRRRLLALSAFAVAAPVAAGSAAQILVSNRPEDRYVTSAWRKLSDADWKKRLSPGAYQILRHEATEIAGTSALLREHRKGTFACAGCGLALFKSDWKFESGTGWPSFYTALPGALGRKTDLKIGVPRTEYHCAQCLGHQGHVFDDGPRPTGLRYCNNGQALRFVPA